MTAALYLTLLATGRRLDLALLAAVFPIFLGLLLVVAFALLFSSLTSSALAAIFTVGIAVAGRFTDVIRNLREVAPDTPAVAGAGAVRGPAELRPLRPQGPRHLRRSRSGGRAALDRRLRGRLDRHRARARARRLPLPRLPVTKRLVLLLRCPGAARPVRPGPHRGRTRGAERSGAGAVSLVGRAREEALSRLRVARRRPLLAAHRPVLRERAAVRAREALRAPAAAHRDHDGPRSAPRGRVPVRGDVPRRARRPRARGGRTRRSRSWKRASATTRAPGGCGRSWGSFTTSSCATLSARRRCCSKRPSCPERHSGSARWRRTSCRRVASARPRGRCGVRCTSSRRRGSSARMRDSGSAASTRRMPPTP